MKLNKFLLGLFATAAFCACTNDDDLGNPNQVIGDKASLTIKLINPDGVTGRGTAANPEFDESNVAIENEVKWVDFYFYNGDGTFNQHVDKSVTFNANTGNVEEIGQAGIVLQNLKQNGLPKFVVVVINGKYDGSKWVTGEYKNLNLTELYAQIKKDYKQNSNFTITNTTYKNNVANSMNYATELVTANFTLEKTTATPVPVEVYVERLAAKVKVTSSITDIASATGAKVGEFTVNGVHNTDIFVKVTGWGLNATATENYTIKHVDTAWIHWTTGATMDDWYTTAATFKRSYWGQSVNYNNTNYAYPMYYGFSSTADENLKTPITGKDYLTYNKYTDMDNALDAVDYCMENTNTKTILEKDKNIKATTTHVILRAQAIGYETTHLVRYYGQLYTAEDFYKNVLEKLTENITVDGTAIAYTDIEAKNAYDGKAYVGLTAAAAAKPLQIGGVTKTADDVNNALKALFTGTGSEYADFYKEGKMYYCIPIEHLRNGKITYADPYDGKYTVEEGDYGVVRNHYYRLNVSEIKNLGTSIIDPDEPIVPNPEDPSYSVSANINILSWKIVNQDVKL